MKKNSVKAVLNMSKLNIAAKINKARIIAQAIDNHPNVFTTPSPSLQQVYSAITNLEMAAADAADGGRAKTKMMYNREADLMTLMNDLAAYVQAVAAGDPAVIFLANMDVKSFPGRRSNEFSAENGKHSGDVLLQVKAVRGAGYFWQYCIDPISDNGWVNAAEGLYSKVTLHQLKPGTLYWFRVALLDKSGRHPFNKPVSLMVV